MRIETLEQRIENAKKKIEKKQNTIIKKTGTIEKKKATLVKKYGINPDTFDKYNKEARDAFGSIEGNDIFWTMCEIDNLKEDIKRGTSEIEETKASLEKYEKQLAGEIEKESVLLKEVPETMKRMQNELVERWDEYDKNRRDRIKEDYSKLSYKELTKKYTGYDLYTVRFLTDDQIHKSNLQDAKILILNLYYRIKDITGEVIDWGNIFCEMGAYGSVLTGYVVGKEGRASVETILAGGYNIQRLHVRTLVHSF